MTISSVSSILSSVSVPHIVVASALRNKNSKGEPICDSQEKLRSFWNWFGGSKVVDRYKRPLVVYHGTKYGGFPEFSHDKIDKHHAGFFFSSSHDVASTYSDSDDAMDVIKTLTTVKSFSQAMRAVRTFPKVGESTLELEEKRQVIDDGDNYDNPRLYRYYLLWWNTGGRYRQIGEYHPYAENDKGTRGDDDEFIRFINDVKLAVTNGPERPGIYHIYLSMKNPLVIDGKGAPWNAVEFEGRRTTISNISHYALARGYDGLIVRNAYDSKIIQVGASDIFVAFDPKQIKSVTHNIGDFNPASGNIAQ